MKDIQLMVVTHKQKDIPNGGPYIPTLVGSNKDSIKYDKLYRDDSADNISEKNPNFCELTALYWASKNLSAEYIGLVHYRRFFMSRNNVRKIVQQEELESILDRVDVILPKKRNYYIENTWDHFKHNHNISDLIVTKSIIEEKYPDYIKSFDSTMKETKSHRFNMMIMKKELFDDYCEWLFDILFELESRVDISHYDSYQVRMFGFISERLLDVWIETNHISYEELPFKFTEKQNWFLKIFKFLKNKFI